VTSAVNSRLGIYAARSHPNGANLSGTGSPRINQLESCLFIWMGQDQVSPAIGNLPSLISKL
jgi:hypothetical protein